ncbi:MFS transporter, partial [Pseudomonas protegens]|nr:MFS transporter [Pseudomonas protegens]
MSWFSELNTVEKRTFYSAFGGWALDALDFMVFTFVIASLMTLWHIDKGSVGLLST